MLSIIAALAGMWKSHQLIDVHLVENEMPAGVAPDVIEGCEETEVVDCKEAAGSKWGWIPFGAKEGDPRIPTALAGKAYFAVVLCWLVMIGLSSPQRWWAHLIYAGLTAIGLGCSIFFEYIMWTELDKLCELCIWTHVLSLLLFVFALLMWPRRTTVAEEPPKRAPATPVARQPWPHWRMVFVTPLVAGLACGALLAEYYVMEDAARRKQAESPIVHGNADKLLALHGDTHSPGDLRAGTSPSDPASDGGGKTTRTDDTGHSDEHEGSEGDEGADAQAGNGDEELNYDDHESIKARIDALKKDVSKYKYYATRYKRDYDFYAQFWQVDFAAWLYSPVIPINIEGRPVRGPDNAPHTLVVFSDLQCPHCRLFERFIEDEVFEWAKETGGVKFVFKHYPICTECNPHAGRNLHPAACDAHLALEAAYIVGGNDAYWKMYDLLWARQDEWKTSRRFDGYAGQVGLDVEAFKSAMKSPVALQAVQADCSEAVNLGSRFDEKQQRFYKVSSTPTAYFDSKRVYRLTKSREFWTQMLRTRSPEAAAGAGVRAPGDLAGQ